MRDLSSVICHNIWKKWMWSCQYYRMLSKIMHVGISARYQKHRCYLPFSDKSFEICELWSMNMRFRPWIEQLPPKIPTNSSNTKFHFLSARLGTQQASRWKQSHNAWEDSDPGAQGWSSEGDGSFGQTAATRKAWQHFSLEAVAYEDVLLRRPGLVPSTTAQARRSQQEEQEEDVRTLR